MKIRNVLISGITLFMLFTSCGHKNVKQNITKEPSTYKGDVISPQNVELATVYPTILKGQEDVEIKPRVDGFIEMVYVDEGDIVKKNQALFKINSPTSVKTYEQALANYNTAKLDVERMEPLAEKKIISSVQLESYKNALDVAKAALDQAKASLEWVTVTSPVDGVVGTITYRQGSLVNNTSVLTTVSNTKNIYAYFSMNEKELLSFLRNLDGDNQKEKINNIPPVKLTLADGSTYEEPGKIETISGVVSNSGSVNIRAVFPNNHGLLLSGTSGNINIPNLLNNVFLIPQKATYFMQDKILVYKYAEGKAISTVVDVKATPDGKSYAVLSGLNSGDVIITDGIATLSDGMQVQVQ